MMKFLQTITFVSFCCHALVSIAYAASQDVVDPLNSPQWGVMHKLFLNQETVVFDDRVKVFAPKFAEDSMNVPVSFNADSLEGIKEIVVIADLNPIPLVLRFYPDEIKPYLAFRIKLQQASPVRAAVKTGDNIWHVGGVWVDAAGGGCTLPSVGTSTGDWSETLGKVSANLWKRSDAPNRLRVRIMHPMDTGLASGIPKFHIEKLQLRDKQGKQLARLEIFEPISENPMLSLDVDNHEHLIINGRDNNGNIIDAEVSP